MIALSTASAMVAVPLLAQQPASPPAPTGAIIGYVVDDSTRQPLAMVEVYIPSAAKFARTDSTGRFFFGDLERGSYDVRARRLGYEPLSRSLALNPADTVEHELGMIAAPQVISQVQVRIDSDPKVEEVERKKKGGMGRYLSREDLAPYDDRLMFDVLSRMPGMRLVRGNRGDYVWVASTRGGGGAGTTSLSSEDQRNGADPRACYAAVYVDRGAVYQGRYGDYLFNINRVPPSAVESIEWYASSLELPAEYNMFGPTCGALVFTLR